MNIQTDKPSWKNVILHDIAHVERGKFSARPRNDPKYFGGTIPFLQTGDVSRVSSGGVVQTYSQTLNDTGLAVSKLFGAHTLLITIAANIGDVAAVPFQFACTDSLVAVTAHNQVDQNWLKYFLSTKKSYFVSKATQNAQANINLQTIRPLKVNLPPLPEQKAIAHFLHCWDRGIQKLEAKIATKEHVKKGLMQQLLSGQIRLPDFAKEGQTGDRASIIPDRWETMPLGSIFTFFKSHAFSRERLTTEASSQPHIYNIHYGDLHSRYQGPLLDFNRERRVPVLKDPTSIKEKLEFLKDGDLVMADVSEDFKGVGTCIELLSLEDRKVTGGLHTFVLRDTSGKTVEGFRGYLFKEHRLAQELRRISTGVSVYGLSKTNLGKVLLVLPPLEEQKAIVKVLNAADRELDALRRKLDNWKAQKKYLLNNLVDGRIRLPEFLESEKEVAH